MNHKSIVTIKAASLLYIACTRAMHKLTLLHTGKLSYFFSEEKDATFLDSF